jgi:hypothetical protein
MPAGVRYSVRICAALLIFSRGIVGVTMWTHCGAGIKPDVKAWMSSTEW